jgi:hypothetical protein
VEFEGKTFDKLETSGLTLNPDDGFLYGIAKDGNFTGIIKVDPVTAEAVVIVEDMVFNTGAAGLSFASDGTFWLAIGNEIGTVNLAVDDPAIGPVGTFTVVVDLAKSISVDGFAIQPDGGGGSVAFFGDGTTLYKVVDLDGTPIVTLLNADVGISLDALSFDDNGGLWGADNQGQIISIDTETGIGTPVTTIANNEITSSGLSSLAISIEDPGTYISVFSAMAASLAAYTVFVDQTEFSGSAFLDDASTTTGLTEFDSYLFTSGEVTVERVSDGNPATVDPLIITDNNDPLSDDITDITLRNDDDLMVTINDFDTVNVFVGGAENTLSSITVNNATDGTLITGVLSNGTATEIGATSDSVFVMATGSGSFDIKTGAGDDTITLDGSLIAGNDGILYTIDGGTGFDTLILANEDGTVNLDTKGIEKIDLTDGAGTEITLTPEDVLDTESVVAFGDSPSLTHTLTVDGDAGDTVNALAADGWTNTGGGVFTATVAGVSVDQLDVNGDLFTTTVDVDVILNVDPDILTLV